MEIIDAQIHPPHPRLHLDEKYGPELAYIMGIELAREAMDSVGVDVAVLAADLAWVERALAMYPDRFAGAVQYSVQTPDIEAYVARARRKQGILGLRFSMTNYKTGEVQPFVTTGQLEPMLVACEREGLPIFVNCQGNARYLDSIAQKHPKLTIVMDHLGLPSPPPMAPVAPDPWKTLPDVLAMAKYPNVHVKFTGVTSVSKQTYPYADLWPNLHKIVNAFTTDRLMWGTDFTRLRMGKGTLDQAPRDQWAGLYSENVHFLRDTTELSQGDKEKIFALNIRRVLRWPKQPPAAGKPAHA